MEIIERQEPTADINCPGCKSKLRVNHADLEKKEVTVNAWESERRWCFKCPVCDQGYRLPASFNPAWLRD